MHPQILVAAPPLKAFQNGEENDGVYSYEADTDGKTEDNRNEQETVRDRVAVGPDDKIAAVVGDTEDKQDGEVLEEEVPTAKHSAEDTAGTVAPAKVASLKSGKDVVVPDELEGGA